MGKQGIKMYPFLKNVKHIFLDTMFFIYHFERETKFLGLTTQVLNFVESGKILCSTSCLTLMEILAKPMKIGREDLVDEYKMLFETFPNLKLIPLETSVAHMAAYFRSAYSLKPADAVQIASAAVSGADHFLTNDSNLIKIKELNICYMNQIVKP
jgi:predicted nucleic acid-binding protein